MENEIIRPIEVITEEINFYKARAGESILEIGKRLTEAKAQLQHGEWLEFLSEKVSFSEASAQRFMRIAKEYSNPSPVTDLGVSKALLLLALAEEEREEFISEKHEVNGKEKTVEEMSKRELEKVIKERDEARKESEDLSFKISDLEEELRELHEELSELKDKPTVIAEPGEEVLDTIRKEEADKNKAKIEKLEKKIAKLEEEKKKAEAEVEKNSADSRKEVEAFKLEKEKLSAEVEALNKKLAVSGNTKLVEFKAHFNVGRDAFNSMFSIIACNELDKASKEKLINTITQLITLLTDSLNDAQNVVYGGSCRCERN